MIITSNFIISTIVSIIVIFITLLFFSAAKKLIKNKKGIWYNHLRIGKHEILNADNIYLLLRSLVNYSQWILIIVEIYLSIPFILKENAETKAYADKLTDDVIFGIQNIANGFFKYIPNLIFIAFIILISNKLIDAVSFIFKKIENKEIDIDNFYPEWAQTTKKLLVFLIAAFTFVIIYPYLPGAGSKALEGVSVFLGLLISLGSSSAISNLIAGVMLTYMRSFKVGDYIKTGNNLGKVVEKGLTVTKLCTFKNEIIVLPNTQILNSEVINYSDKARNKELILHTTVTLGYDTPWTLIHKIMKEAAQNCSLVNHEKEPFILQTSLNDYHISYELNIYTEHVELLPRVYSELHENIQNIFAKYNLEIMSPGFTVFRSNPKNTTPSFEEITKVNS